MRNGDHDIERTLELSRGRVEIRAYDWRPEWNGLRRARPDAYILELNLSHSDKASSAQRGRQSASTSFQIGDVAMIPPDSKVQRNIAPGWRRALLCMFDRVWLDSLLSQLIHEGSGHSVKCSSLGRTEWLLRNIYQEMCQEENLGGALVVESFANVLAVELARRLALRKTADRCRKGGLAPWRMRLLQERILSNVTAPNLTELAELCDMTVRHLCRAFKAETGMTPGQYIDAARAQHARILLSETNFSLTDIAHRLGFATSASLSNAFQRATGLKPRQIERPTRSAPPAGGYSKSKRGRD